MMRLRANMRQDNRSRRHQGVIVAIALITLMNSGCASLSPSKNVLPSAHQVITAKQAKVEDTLKPLPAMVSTDYEAAGDRYRHQGDLSMAFLQYDKALRLAPNDLDVRYKQSRLFLQKGNIQEAIEAFETIIKQDETHSLAYQGLGEAYFRVPNLQKAEANCRKAIELDKTLWLSYNCLGMIYDRQKRFGEAVKAYQTAHKLQPRQSMVLNNLGISYYIQEKYKMALETLQKALVLEKDPTRLYNNLGVVLSKLGRHEEAFDMFAKSGNPAQAHNNLGVVQMAAGQYREAIASFEKAIASHPNYYETARQNLTLARRALATSYHGDPAPSKAPNAKQ